MGAAAEETKPLWTAPITYTQTEDARAATRVSTQSELGNAKGKVARVVEVPQPPPNKHSVDGDGRGAPAKKKAKTKKPRGAASRARDIAKNKYHNANT